MRTFLSRTFVCVACAAPRLVECTPVMPLAARAAPTVEVERDVPRRADADRSPPTVVDGAPVISQPSVTYRTVTQLVEVPSRDQDGGDVDAYRVDPYRVDPYYGAPYYYDYEPRYYYGHRRHRETTFPVGTLVGAGVGAAIGRHNGHRGRGAWIGGGIGLLLDLNRWHH